MQSSLSSLIVSFARIREISLFEVTRRLLKQILIRRYYALALVVYESLVVSQMFL